jgi:aerobic-type carbon monoxide dehydrogenase small subunit (CoxS/CutS family)
MKRIQVKLSVNGVDRTISSYPNRTLMDVLREDLGLTSVKNACSGEGECGACTVIMDGRAVNSCLILIGQADGHQIETVEGLSNQGTPHYLQTAFVKAGAVQCGFCTPGLLMTSKALLDQNPHPSEEQIREALAGNLCRCTGYTKIVAAVRMASEESGDAV